MQLPDELSQDQHRALVECIMIFRRRGVALRLEREARERATQAQNGQNTIPADERAAATQGEASIEHQTPTNH
jgi:hypothetical protein